jgi:hypothetical protein
MNLKNERNHSKHNDNRSQYTRNKVGEISAGSWQDLVPRSVANIIAENWKIIEKYAQSQDKTIKIFGMKFPTEGIL